MAANSRGYWPILRELAHLRLANEILAIGRGLHRFGQPQQLLGIDETLNEGDFLRAGHLQPLPLLDALADLLSLQQRLMRAGVEPRIAAAEALDVKIAALEIPLIEIGDLQFAPGGWL